MLHAQQQDSLLGCAPDRKTCMKCRRLDQTTYTVLLRES